jgi:tryptophan synthase alpha chain
MVAQNTTNERLEIISKIVKGFIYVVAVMGVTGARKNLEINTVDLINRVRKHTELPICVGFGISQPDHVKKVIKAGGDGAIVASALINIIEKNLDQDSIIYDRIFSTCLDLKKATKNGADYDNSLS